MGGHGTACNNNHPPGVVCVSFLKGHHVPLDAATAPVTWNLSGCHFGSTPRLSGGLQQKPLQFAYTLGLRMCTYVG